MEVFSVIVQEMDLTLNFLEKWKNAVKNKTKNPPPNHKQHKNPLKPQKKNSRPTPPEKWGNRTMQQRVVLSQDLSHIIPGKQAYHELMPTCTFTGFLIFPLRNSNSLLLHLFVQK